MSLKGSEPTETQVKAVAQKTLLSTNGVTMWLNHLNTIQQNRRRGAKKAAATRRRKSRKGVLDEEQESLEMEEENQEETEYRCGICSQLFEEETEEELWIACDECSSWFHAVCVNIDDSSVPENFLCVLCQNE